VLFVYSINLLSTFLLVAVAVVAVEPQKNFEFLKGKEAKERNKKCLLFDETRKAEKS